MNSAAPPPEAVLLMWDGAYYPTNGASQWPGHYVTALIPQEKITLATIESDGSIVQYVKRMEHHPSTVFSNVAYLKEFWVHPDDINIQPCAGWVHFAGGSRVYVNDYGGRRWPCGTLKLAKDLTTNGLYSWDMQWGSGVHWFPTYMIGNVTPQVRPSSGELGGDSYPGGLTGSNYYTDRPNYLSFCHPGADPSPYFTKPHGWFGFSDPVFEILSWSPDLSSGIMVLDTHPEKGPFMLRGPKTIQSLFDFLGKYGAGSLLADIDGNAVVDVGDVFAFISRWFDGH